MKTIKVTITILLMSFAVVLSISAQNVTFCSPEFAEGVKMHLGLNEKATVTQLQTDTITAINLSGFGIKDIRDVVYLPNVKKLDLSFNDIRDVAPLLPLGSLHNVDLRGNLLEDINILSFSRSDSMVVNVAYNYIRDFSRFFLPSSCQFRIAGMSAQKDKNATYIDVYQLSADIDNDQTLVNYRGYSNIENGIFINYCSTNANAVLDGNYNTVKITENLQSTTKVSLTNGTQSETTYVVPSAIYSVGAGKTATLETGLPDDYYISSAYALKGLVEIDGNRMKYTAPAKAVSDIVVFSYYQGATLKGFSRYYVNMGTKGDVNISGVVDVQDAALAVNYILGKVSDEDAFDFLVADMNGDGVVDVFDVTAIINVILSGNGNTAGARSLARQDAALESIRLTTDDGGLLFDIDRADRFTSFQFDVEVPDGAKLEGVEWGSKTGHRLQFAKNGEHRYTVVALSLSSNPLPVSDGTLLKLQLSDTVEGEVSIGNVLFVTPEGRAARFNGGTMSMATGIVSATLNDKGQMVNDEWYDLDGRKMSGQPKRKGVYIFNNKKVVIK